LTPVTSRPPGSRAWLAALLAALAASLAFLVYAGYRTLAQPVAAVTPATMRPLPGPHASPAGAAVAPPDASSGRYPPEDPHAGVTQTPEAAFRDLRTALERKDAAAAARYLLAAKRAEMQSVEEALSELTPLEAQGVRITKTTQRGDKAALFARAESPDITSADGTPAGIDVVVQMVREGGQWKVFRQLWLVNTPPAEFQRKAIAWLGAAQE
jgi:hypothetical protein